jgi:peptide/nickel transport system substrate-binding protein
MSGWFVLILMPLFSVASVTETDPLRILVDRPPITLNPRQSLDLTGQRLGALLFLGLTRLDNRLQPVPGLAKRWRALEQGKTWEFEIQKGLIDESGEPITADQVAQCLENYRGSKPVSNVGMSFRGWLATEVVGTSTLRLRFASPEAYLPQNASLLRYFRQPGKTPCEEPNESLPLLASTGYRLKGGNWRSSALEQGWEIIPSDPQALRIQFRVIRDEPTRILKLLAGEFDAAQNVLTLAKTRWIAGRKDAQFRLLKSEGVNLSYLAFNTRDPILKDSRVRRALAHAIDRPSVVRYRMLEMGSVATGVISPLLPESTSHPYEFNLTLAGKLLDEAGFPVQASGIRFSLQYKTTPVREGFETALMIREMLSKIGVRLVLDVVEPGTFFASIRKGSYQIFSSRFIGIADGSIFRLFAHSKERRNTTGFKDAEIDAWIERAMSELDPKRRHELLKKIQTRLYQELPLFPLWTWDNALLLKSGWSEVSLSLSGAYDPLLLIRRLR